MQEAESLCAKKKKTTKILLSARALDLDDLAPVGAPDRFDIMAQCARTMVREVIRALVHRDPGLARTVLADDVAVDDLQTEILHAIEEEVHQCPRAIPPSCAGAA